GQLRRHSARQGILSKTQKQNFARSRQQANNPAPRQPSTFRGIPDPDNRDDDSRCTDPQPFTGFSTTSPRSSLLAGSIPVDSTGRLKTLKRRLLQDPDWAAVAAARPLKVTFTSAREAEHFGKRRRLTEEDRKRLSATHGNQAILAFPRSHYWRDRESSLDKIQIKITSQPASQHLQNSQCQQTHP
ncbi:uncharacterized protein N7458_001138, partial [Penicillium daleae]